MATSDLIAYASALIAILSAIYSYRAVGEAKKANVIAIHDRRLEIYNSLNTLWLTLQRNGVSIDYRDIAKQTVAISDYAHLYFDKKLTNDLLEYCDICFELANINRKTSRKGITEPKLEELYVAQDKLLLREVQLYKHLKSELSLQMSLAG